MSAGLPVSFVPKASNVFGKHVLAFCKAHIMTIFKTKNRDLGR